MISDENMFASTTRCEVCWRRSTKFCELRFYSAARCCMRSIRYGRKIKRSSLSTCVNLCGSCVEYAIEGNLRWKSIWPAYIWSILYGHILAPDSRDKVLKALSWELRMSWMDFEEHLSCPQTAFRDFTKFIIDHPLPSGRMLYDDFYRSLEQYALPMIRCPWGCFVCLLEGYGTIPLHHLFYTFDSSIRVSQAGHGIGLVGIRSDWLDRCVAGLFDLVSVCPGTVIDAKGGLSFITCCNHQRGSRDQYIHVPYHPTLGSVPLSQSDNLAMLHLQPRVVKPAKTGVFCTTWQLYRESFTSNGLSCFSLAPDGVWNHVSPRTCVAESVTLRERRDVFEDFIRRVDRGQVPNHIAEAVLLSLKDATTSDICIGQSLSGSTMVDASDVMRMRQLLMHSGKTADIDRDVYVPYAHESGPYGSRPRTPSVIRITRATDYSSLLACYLVWMLLVTVSVCPAFCMSLLSTSSSSSSLWIPCRKQLKLLIESLVRNKRQSPHPFFRAIANILSIDNHGSQRRSFCSDFAHCLRICLHSAGIRCYALDVLEISAFLADVSTGDESSTGGITFIRRWSQDEGELWKLSDSPLPTILGSRFHLRAVYVVDESRSSCNIIGYVRHGGGRTGWWECHYGQHATMSSTEDFQFKFKSVVCVQYSLVDDQQEFQCNHDNDVDFMSFLDGQRKVFCKIHRIRLVKDDFPSSFFCCFSHCPNRQHKSVFSCPFATQCRTAICSKAYAFICDSIRGPIYYIAPPDETQLNSAVVKQIVRRSQIQASQQYADEDIADGGACFVGDVSSDDDTSDETSCDICPQASSADIYLSNPFADRVSGVFLINGLCGALKRRAYVAKLSRRAQRLFQSLVSKSGDCCSLLYPEALVLPVIFWVMFNGSIPGALPITLYSDSLGFASFRQHAVLRLMDWASLCSSDSTYGALLFDFALNTMLRYSTLNMVMRIGWEHISGAAHRVPLSSKEVFTRDYGDHQKRVRELASLISSSPPLFFVTLTANQDGTPTLKPINDLMQRAMMNESRVFVDAESLRQAACTPMLVNWYHTVQKVVEFICSSPQKPLGEITHFWGRYEFNESNLPHYHLLLWSNENVNIAKHRICCSFQQFYSWKEKLMASGLVKNELDWDYLCDLYHRVQQHSCQASAGKCQKRDVNGNLVCKVPYYPPSTTTIYSEIDRDISEEDFELYCDIGWARIDENGQKHIRLDWKPGRWLYATDHHDNIQWVPCNPYLFCLCRANVNVLLTDWSMCARYLASYAGKSQTYQPVLLKAGGPTSTSIDMGRCSTSTKKQQQLGTIQNHRLQGRLVTLPEAIFYTLGFEYVHTNVSFLHVNTDVAENRPLVHKPKKRRLGVSNFAEGPFPFQYYIRERLPEQY